MFIHFGNSIIFFGFVSFYNLFLFHLFFNINTSVMSRSINYIVKLIHSNGFSLNFLYNGKMLTMKHLKLITVTLLTDNNNDLIVFSLNIRSIRNYFNELLLVFNSGNIKFYFVMFSKPWFDNDIIG